VNVLSIVIFKLLSFFLGSYTDWTEHEVIAFTLNPAQIEYSKSAGQVSIGQPAVAIFLGYPTNRHSSMCRVVVRHPKIAYCPSSSLQYWVERVPQLSSPRAGLNSYRKVSLFARCIIVEPLTSSFILS
jgi:hypothetical protein